jgi:predicted ribosome quality control (RQC) complex YloA/Tae2 family protein
MNNFFALIYLTKEINHKYLNSEFLFSYSPHKDVWEGYFKTPANTHRLVFSTHPAETALFSDSERAPKKNNVTTFFDQLAGDIVSDISLADHDRFIYMSFQSGRTLLFQIFGNKPNVLLIQDRKICESFKGGNDLIGRPEPTPRAPRDKPAPDKKLSPKRTILHDYPTFPRHLIQPVIEHYNLDGESPTKIREITDTLVGAMLNTPEFRILTDGNLCLIPNELLPLENMETFKSVNDAIRFAYYKTSRERRLSSRIDSLKPKIEESIRKNRSVIKQLEQADKGIERAKKYEQYGHLLMANAHRQIHEATDKITVENFYDGNKNIDIPLKTGLSVAENAERYYDKSSKAERSVDESKRRLKQLKKETSDAEQLLKSFQKIEKIYEFDSWYKDHEPELKRLGILRKTQKTTSLPYRRLSIGNYEVWVGKNAKSNDRLTADAHKEDVWLHARGVAGSHVVIRMNNQKEMPPKHVILQAASIAAWNSKARGSNLVPVIVTKRKYVTKPKGVPAGAVRVQREEVEMVSPRENPLQ